MADRLEAVLDLDATDAFSTVDSLAARVEAAFAVPLQLDTAGVPSEIEGAVDAADSNVVVTGEATELTGDVEGAIDAADENVTVTGDAGELTGDVTAAIDAGDSNVTVTGDASELTGSIDAALFAADSHMVVTGEAGSVTGAIDAAVGAADKHIELEADASGLQAANLQGEILGETLGNVASEAGSAGVATTAAGEASGTALGTAALASRGLGFDLATLKSAAGGLGIAFGALEAKDFLAGAISGASDLAESTSKAQAVFGDATPVILNFGDTAAQSVGLAKQEAIEAAATFGNLFQALGVARGEAVTMSTDVVSLSADLASFNNIPVPDALERIRSGLVGEIEPLRRMGISFNAAQVEAKALQLGLAGTTEELTEGDKVVARYNLILEQTQFAQGDFARTSDQLANSQRIASAEFKNAQTELGQQLLPAMLELTKAGSDLIAIFGPALTSALGGFASTLGTLTGAVNTVLGPLGGLGGILGNEIVGKFLGLVNPATVATTALGLLGDGLDFISDDALSANDALAVLSDTAAADFLPALDAVGQAMSGGLLGGGAGATANQLQLFNDAIDQGSIKLAERMIPALREAGVSGDFLRGKINEARDAAREHGGATDEEAAAADRAAEAQQRQADAINEYKTALDSIFGPQLSVIDANIKYQQSVADLGPALLTSAAGTGAVNLANLDVQSSASGAAQSALDLANAIFTQTGNTQAASGVITTFRDQLIDQLGAFGVSRQAAEDFANSLGLTPGALDAAGTSIGAFSATHLVNLPLAAQRATDTYELALAAIPESTRNALAQAGVNIDTISPGLINNLGTVGSSLAVNFGFGLVPIPGSALNAIQGAQNQVNAAGPGAAGAAGAQGGAVANQWGFGVGGIPGVTQGAVAGAGPAIGAGARGLGNPAYNEGAAVGSQFGDGVAGGIASRINRVVQIARQMIDDAAAAARERAEAASPSRLMERLGADMATGTALGMDRATPEVVRAAENIVQAAAAGIGLPTAPPPPPAAAAFPSSLDARLRGTDGLEAVLGELVREIRRRSPDDRWPQLGSGAGDFRTRGSV